MIYHYTTIEALALILHNKTIRFNRLDNGLNDLEESELSILDCELQDKIFISCWTKNRVESIPLWRMYSHDGIGVSIGFDNNLFGDPTDSGENYTTYLCTNILTPSNKVIIPISLTHLDQNSQPKDTIGNIFMSEVSYSVNRKKKLNESVCEITINNEKHKQIDLGKIGSIKNPIWRFEKETRFKIFAGNSQDRSKEHVKYRYLKDLRPLTNNNEDVTSLFVPIMDYAFKNFEVILSPKCTMAHRLIVDSLLNTYLPSLHIKCKESKLKNRVSL